MNELEATRAKLKCLETVEGTGLDWWNVIRQLNKGIFCGGAPYLEDKYYNGHNLEFALGVIEGKPVWEGDELWNVKLNRLVIAKPLCGEYLKDATWNQPKPVTLMVELPIDTAKSLSKSDGTTLNGYNTLIHACRKALEQLK